MQGQLAIVLLLMLISSSLAALAPVLLKLIVDTFASVENFHAKRWVVAFLIAAYAGSHFAARMLGELRTLRVGRVDQRLHRQLSLRLFTHVMALPLTFHLDRRTGALNQALNNGLVGYRLLLQHMLSSVLPMALELVFMSAVLLVFGYWIYTLIAVGTLVCYAIAFYLGTIRMAKPARDVSISQIDATALLTDSVINYEAIKSFCAEQRVQRRMANALAKTEATWGRLLSYRARHGMAVASVFVISLATSTYIAAESVQRDIMTLGEFVLINAYMVQIFRPVETLGFAIRDMAQGVVFVEKLVDLLGQEGEHAALPSSKLLPSGRGSVVFDGVWFSYTKGRPVLKDLCFTISAGTTVALVGASGTGKSSILRLLLKFHEPDRGRIFLDGMAISEASASSLRQAIAVVPQDTVLFNDSIAYNISVGSPNSSRDDIVAAARLAGIHNLIIARLGGYDTLVGERGLKLSGGEKQRIAIARAALKKPRIFVFDEATSSLDSMSERQILSNLNRLSKGTTTLVVAHRLSTIVEANEILVLKQGKIIEQGNHRSLLQSQGTYQSMWVNQQGPFSYKT